MNVGIIGLGLMGSSMALALKKYCENVNVYGYDQDENNFTYIINNNIIDQKLTNKIIPQLDILFIAVPVRTIPMVINHISPYLNKEKTLLTDMGSTKSYICQQIKEKFPRIDFIGGHPMTGKEVSGPENALPDLFTNMTYILIEKKNLKKQDEDRFNVKKNLLVNVLDKLQCKLVFMESRIHDEIVALTSHLPHFIAISFINRVIDYENKYSNINMIMGQGFRDFTRIAACSPNMWNDIFVTNRKHIITQVDDIIDQMVLFREAINKKDEEKIYEFLQSAQKKRLSLNEDFEKVSSNGI